MVNISMRKAFNGSDDYTVEALNEKYKQGYRLDIDFVANNRAADTHCGWENFRLR
jgi:hypothetical protein